MIYGFDPSSVPRFVFSIPIIGDLWWFWIFWVLLFSSLYLWLSYIQEFYKRSIPYIMLELRIPREVRKSPRAMEQVFMSIHGLRNSPNDIAEKWWEGEVTLWFSCELVSFGGDIHFYMRIPKKHRNLIEAALYAQYSDIELAEVTEDYIHRLPATVKELRQNNYELFGNELRLAKEDAYPIRTYVDFEAPDEERQLDPISSMLEVLAKLKPAEICWIQILIRPTDDSWKEANETLVEELKEKMATRRYETEGGGIVMVQRTPGEVEVIEAVERNLQKPGFESLIRYIYTAPKEIYGDTFPRRGVYGAFNQYATEHLNKFAHNTKAWTRTKFWHWPHLFPKKRQRARQERIFQYYRERRMFDETTLGAILRIRPFHWYVGAQKLGKMVLNVEELATIFHPPMFLVLTGPLIKSVESRKIGPPAGLPIYGEEGEEKLPGIK